MKTQHSVYVMRVFRNDLQVHGSLARVVMVDREMATNSRTLHKLNGIINSFPNFSGQKIIIKLV